MILTIPVNNQNRFKYYLSFLNPILKLTDREIDVLASLMSLYYTNKDKGDLLDNLLFATYTRKMISKYLNMTIFQYNNIIFSLRKKGIIKDNKIIPSLLMNDIDNIEINIKFNNAG